MGCELADRVNDRLVDLPVESLFRRPLHLPLGFETFEALLEILFRGQSVSLPGSPRRPGGLTCVAYLAPATLDRIGALVKHAEQGINDPDVPARGRRVVEVVVLGVELLDQLRRDAAPRSSM